MAKRRKMAWLGKLTTALVLVGGLNWGLLGFFGLDIVSSIAGTWAPWVYDAVGLSAVYSGYQLLSK